MRWGDRGYMFLLMDGDCLSDETEGFYWVTLKREDSGVLDWFCVWEGWHPVLVVPGANFRCSFVNPSCNRKSPDDDAHWKIREERREEGPNGMKFYLSDWWEQKNRNRGGEEEKTAMNVICSNQGGACSQRISWLGIKMETQNWDTHIFVRFPADDSRLGSGEGRNGWNH